MAEEAPGNTLNATTLVHEAYLRLIGPADDIRWENRGHFFAAEGNNTLTKQSIATLMFGTNTGGTLRTGTLEDRF